MKKLTFAVLAPLGLALAGCGSADDASVEAQPDTVEMPADDAMAGVTAEPVADPSANATEEAPSDTETATAEEAGANAADVAARAQAAAAAAEGETETPE